MKKVVIIIALIILALYTTYNRISSSNAGNTYSARDDHQNPSEAVDSVDKNRNSEYLIFELLIKIKELLATNHYEQEEFPPNMDHVKITPNLAEYIKNWSGGYEKLNYRLKLYDRLSQCLGEDEPKTGETIVMFHFDLDRKTQMATGTLRDGDETLYSADSSLNVDDEKKVLDCLLEAHVGLEFNAKQLLMDENIEADRFLHAIRFTFPLKDDELYVFIRE